MKRIGIEDFTDYHYLTGFVMSPDGKYGAMAVVDANLEENGYDSCLWIYEAESGRVRRLTTGKKERKFLWLDGGRLLLIADREEEYRKKRENGEDWTCFYTISAAGGEAKFSFALPYTVSGIKRCGTKLLFTARLDRRKPDFAALSGETLRKAHEDWKEEQDYEIFDELPFWANGQGIINGTRVCLGVYDLETGECEIVTGEKENVEGFWAEDGLVLYASNTYTDMKGAYQALKQYDLCSKETRTIVEQGKMRIDYACVLKGRVTFFGSDMKAYGVNENSKLYVVEDGMIRLLSDYDDSTHNSICADCKFADGSGFAHDEDGIYFLSTLRKETALRHFSADGVLSTLIDRQGSIHTVDVCQGKVYFTGMRGLGLTEGYVFDGKEERKLTSFNDEMFADRSVCRIEEFTFTFKDMELDGYCMKPVDFDPEKTYPGILTVHGGPRAVFGPTFFHENQVFANAGYFVFFTNPFGSDGRGNAFADITGKHGGIDFECCMAMTDEALKRYPQIDEKRLGIMGGSYGGYMANWAIGNTTRFAAAASQRSISNWVSKCMSTDIGHYFDLEQIAANPWTNIEKMWDMSPLKYADMAKTPTLFLQSDEDYRCWMADAIQMFSALKYFGVPTRLCLFHGENHELSRSGKPRHRVRRLREMMDWFEKYLK